MGHKPNHKLRMEKTQNELNIAILRATTNTRLQLASLSVLENVLRLVERGFLKAFRSNRRVVKSRLPDINRVAITAASDRFRRAVFRSKPR